MATNFDAASRSECRFRSKWGESSCTSSNWWTLLQEKLTDGTPDARISSMTATSTIPSIRYAKKS
jgi:hypothetical protein